MTIRIEPGDCLDVMRRLIAEGVTVQSIVTDPPYHLTSIVKRFGSEGAAPAKAGKTGAYARASRGFMGKQWDGGDIAFQVATWKLCFDLLPPGGHLIAFSGARTYHRMACAIEDAGFEIRDQLGWLYGSGFPKSHDVSKAIDKAAGAEREIVAQGSPVKRLIPGADQAKSGWEKNNGRVFVPTETIAATDAARQWQGWGTALKPAWEPMVLARKPLGGTVADCVLKYGTGALNVDGCKVESGQRPLRASNRRLETNTYSAGLGGSVAVGETTEGRWPANIVHDGSAEVLAAFPQSEGQRAAVGPQHGPKSSVNTYGDYGPRAETPPRGDSGSAARFFYSAKADALDRVGARHPTVKPIDLIAWLVRLVTPPGGTVLDPFAGTGTTGIAALRQGFAAVLIERDAEYLNDIRARLALATDPDAAHSAAIKGRHVDARKARGEDTPLFGGGA